GDALFIRFRVFTGLFQSLHQHSAVFGVVWFALGGFAEIAGRGAELARPKGDQTEIEGIVVFVGIKLGGAPKIILRSDRFALARECDAQIIKDLGKIRAGNHVHSAWRMLGSIAQGGLQRAKNFLGLVWLVQLKTTDPGSKNSFDVTLMGFGNARKPRK